MKKAVLLVTLLPISLLLFPITHGEDFLIEDFSDISDWQHVSDYGAVISQSTFSPNTTDSLHITNLFNYADEYRKSINLAHPNLKYTYVVFWFYSNNSYTDILLRLSDRGGNERCSASVTFGQTLGEWHLFKRSIVDFQGCKDKYMTTLGSISFVINDYPSDFYAAPVSTVLENLTQENLTSDPGWVLVTDESTSPSISPKGRPISIICDVYSESFMENVTVNIFYGPYLNITSFMERYQGNLNHGKYRYVFDPLPGYPDGKYSARISAIDVGGNSTVSDMMHFTINSTLDVQFQTDRYEYNLSDTVNISGSAKDVNGDDIVGNISVLFQSSDLQDSFSDGVFIGTFQTSRTVQMPGVVNITLDFDDNHGNAGSSKSNIYVVVPGQDENLTVHPTSPQNDTTFIEGDTVPLSAKVFRGALLIDNATVFANVGGDITYLYFSADHYLTTTSATRTGDLEVTFYAELGDELGINRTYITMLPNPDIGGPDPPPGTPGAPGDVTVNITYENGTPMTGLNVTGITPTGEFDLNETDPGIYSGTYTPGSGDVGEWNLTIDINNNTVDTGFTFSVGVNLLSVENVLIVVVAITVLAVFVRLYRR